MLASVSMSIALSLYIHIPWCLRKCPYCDFNSHKSPNEIPENVYIQSLLTDLKQDLLRYPAREIHSIFIGGGTPSLFSGSAFETLLNEIETILPFSNDIEITLEANPGAIEQQRFMDYRSIGINRLSLGIQSFNKKHLQILGRIHDDQQAHRAIETARKAGFDNINIDLMHSLPNQSVHEGLQDLQLALDHQPEHLSWYQLTIEPNTIFYKQKPTLPTEEDSYALEEEGLSLLNAHHFHRYEISAFCKTTKKARHNLNYWLFGDYLGIGAGAHGKLSLIDQQTIVRTRKQRQPNDYLNLKKPFLVDAKHVSSESLVFEYMLNATRLQQPIPHTLFHERTFLSNDYLAPGLELAQRKGLIEVNDTHWQVTTLGRRFTNDLQALFLHSAESKV